MGFFSFLSLWKTVQRSSHRHTDPDVNLTEKCICSKPNKKNNSLQDFTHKEDIKKVCILPVGRLTHPTAGTAFTQTYRLADHRAPLTESNPPRTGRSPADRTTSRQRTDEHQIWNLKTEYHYQWWSKCCNYWWAVKWTWSVRGMFQSAICHNYYRTTPMKQKCHQQH